MSSLLEYRPLAQDEFRLLILIPAVSITAPLRVHVFHDNVYNPEASYAALSYTWASKLEGNDYNSNDVLESVDVDGHETFLHQNLAKALRSIRLEVPQCIWADALCIDQNNIPERNIQVTLMRQIFSNATNVWAWLGPPAKGSNLAMDFLTDLASRADEVDIGPWLGNEGMHPDTYPTWEGLRALMARNWWKRAWIVQEFALAKDVVFICGTRRLSADALEAADHLIFMEFTPSKNERVTALTRAVDINPRVLDPARNLMSLRRRLQQGEQLSALATLQMTRLTNATDPRDHLFAKIGLSVTELVQLCPPDYNAQAEDIWFTFLKEFIRQKQDLYVVYLAGMQPRTHYAYALPSWLPDWGPSKPQYMLCSLFTGKQWPFFDAASGAAAVATISSEKMEEGIFLRCKGLVVDTVDGVAGDPWWTATDKPTSLRQSKCKKNAYGTQVGAFEALLRTVTAHTNRMGAWGAPPREFNTIFAKRWHELRETTAPYEADEGQPKTQPLPLPFYMRASGFERAWRSMRNLKLDGVELHEHVEAGLIDAQNKAQASSSGSSEEGHEFDFSVPAPFHPLWTALEHSAGQVCYERFVYTTEGGYLGVGSSTVEPGDKVVVLLGCKVPVVLRPLEKGGYQLIGETYLDGAMYGEMTKDIGKEGSAVPVEDLDIF
ncbi:uncharacterized protein J4E84_005015 [Alternaria hordeiaustralica]|uniref:uncharacterized protein n=1 Tax=Alternaria hordeiaustralica TaxID=1187925 RepID=UPI0020C45D55|nr:uncharacterized protein J4E84_005015 [Alternaria hordeiaustralica]KAI4688087.1 hypothetical protein J4E84_005015 [Alternaria hordeiaustralica]